MDVAKIIARRAHAERGVRVAPSDEMLLIGELIAAAMAEQLPKAIARHFETTGIEDALARDTATMIEVRKLLARFHPKDAGPSRTEYALWAVSAALVVALLALAFLLKLV